MIPPKVVQTHKDGEWSGGSRGGGGEDGKLEFNVSGAAVWEDGNVLEVGGADGCTTT